MTVYIIDGYNVLHELLGHAVVDDLEDQRNRLVDRIASYMGGTADRAILVFDSRVQMLQKMETATRNVDVYFGSFSRSADSIIEREVFTISAGQNVTVVSSDYNLQKTIFRPNVIRRSARQFVEDLQIHTKRIANPENCITMNHRIEDRIDPGTVEKLKALREALTAEPGEEGPPKGRKPDPATRAGGTKDGKCSAREEDRRQGSSRTE